MGRKEGEGVNLGLNNLTYKRDRVNSGVLCREGGGQFFSLR